MLTCSINGFWNCARKWRVTPTILLWCQWLPNNLVSIKMRVVLEGVKVFIWDMHIVARKTRLKDRLFPLSVLVSGRTTSHDGVANINWNLGIVTLKWYIINSELLNFYLNLEYCDKSCGNYSLFLFVRGHFWRGEHDMLKRIGGM